MSENTMYVCKDGEGGEVEVSAASAREAAQEYVDDGWWGESEGHTTWVTVYVREADSDDDASAVRIAIDPPEPKCTQPEHDWQSPVSVVGGCRENPGVWGNRGGVVIREVCAHCGRYRILDTWAQDPTDGTQGLESVRYEDADEASEQWVERGGR